MEFLIRRAWLRPSEGWPGVVGEVLGMRAFRHPQLQSLWLEAVAATSPVAIESMGQVWINSLQADKRLTVFGGIGHYPDHCKNLHCKQ